MHFLRMKACVAVPPKTAAVRVDHRGVVVNNNIARYVVPTAAVDDPPHKFWEWVKRIDSNGDGSISRKELEEALRKLGLRCCSLKAWFAIAKADADGNGCISGQLELKELYRFIRNKWGITFL